MRDRNKKKYEEYLKGELEGAAIYGALADVEKDPERAEVFRKLAAVEMRLALTLGCRLAETTAERLAARRSQ